MFANAKLETSQYTDCVTIPATTGQAALSYNGLYVPYVPTSTVNAGVFYDIKAGTTIHILPTASFQCIGTQHIFDNSATPQPIPSNCTMPGYDTMNAGFKIPLKFAELHFTALNILNREFNEYEYEYISGAGYFGTAGNGTSAEWVGYLMAYPGAPVTDYGDVNLHFQPSR